VTQTSPAGETKTVTVRAEGVRGDLLKWGDPVAYPSVAVRPIEAALHDGAQTSKLRDYPVNILVGTHYADDPWGITFLTIADAVGRYLLAPPTLSLNLTSCKFNALTVSAPARRADDGMVRQMVWSCTVRVQIT
jgi:hypothetical protein